MDAWILWTLAAVAVGIVVGTWLFMRRGRRRFSPPPQDLSKRSSAATPAVPPEKLIELVLKQRQEQLASQPRVIEIVPEGPAPSARPAVNPRTMRVPEPAIEFEPAPTEPVLNPVQKMALKQWDEVEVVAAKKPPHHATHAPKAHDAGHERGSSPKAKHHVEVVMSTRKAEPAPESPEPSHARRHATEPTVVVQEKRPVSAATRDSHAMEKLSEPKANRRPIEVNWGDVEVRRDTKRS
jgi:hypothetical protein